MKDQIIKGTSVEVNIIIMQRPDPKGPLKMWFSEYLFSHYEDDITAIVIDNNPKSIYYGMEVRYKVEDIRVSQVNLNA